MAKKKFEFNFTSPDIIFGKKPLKKALTAEEQRNHSA